MGIKRRIQIFCNLMGVDNGLYFNLIKMTTLFVIFYFSSLSTFAQNQINPDSLIAILNNPTIIGKQRLELISRIGRNVSRPEDKLKFAKQLVLEAKELDEYKYVYLGHLYEGYAQKLLGNLTLSLTAYLEAVKISSKNNDKIAEGDAYTNIASLYTSNEDFEKSLKYYDRVVNLYDDNVDSIRLTGLYINYGYAMYKAKMYDSSISILNKAIYFSQFVNNYRSKAYAQANRALVLAKTDQFDEAEVQLGEAMQIMEENNDHYGLSDCLIEIGGVYLEQGEVLTGIQKLKKGYAIAFENGLKEQIQNGAKYLSRAYQQNGDLTKALEYQSKYYTYRDSLTNKEQIRKLADLRTTYEVGQKQTEVDLLTAEKRIQKIIIFSTGGGAFLVAILLGLVYKNYRDKNKINKILEDQKAQLERLNTTKDKFFSIISHDLRGPVHAFSGISRLIKYAVEDKNNDELIEIADHVDKTADDLSGLLDNLLNWALQQQGHFPNVPEKLSVEEMGEEINGIFSNMAKAKNINLLSSIPGNLELWVDRNTSMTILRNLVNNAIKFTDIGGKVDLTAIADGDFAKITVSDTGVGIPQDKLNRLFKMDGNKTSYGTAGEKGLGLGLQLVYEFVEMNKGTIAVESNEGEGTKFIVRLPLFEAVEKSVST
jgi:two-component system, NtrC family, sensor kinase